jgi:ketosteroid isomerase-like protein
MKNHAVVNALWEAFDRFDFAAVAPLLHDDFVCDWPQSGERIRGRDNFIAVNTHYPGRWRITVRRLIACGDEVVTETELRFGEQLARAVSFFTFRDGLIVHLCEYWPDPMPAVEWRRPWVETAGEHHE